MEIDDMETEDMEIEDMKIEDMEIEDEDEDEDGALLSGLVGICRCACLNVHRLLATLVI